ncbi:MAG: winged helix DNA-binding domain-containing protein [Actinobacteria bacterium]|nr:winged helix DNA-binding domain-containing protein [Actinomycetota bacterium]
MTVELTRDQARRIAVRAQLLDARRPTHLVDTVRQLTFVQLEPTAPIAPTADLVLWSRLGARYEPADLTTALEIDNSLFELALMVRPMDDLPLFRAEMAGPPKYEQTARWLDDNAEFRQDILDRLEVEGALIAREIPDTSIVSWPSSGWNNNRNVMMMLECMMMRGDIAVAKREGRDRVWDLAERVYHSDTTTVPLDEALRIRAERRLSAQGLVPVKTPDLPVETTRVGDAGVPAIIDGIKGAYRVDPAALDDTFEPRTALLSPFDGLIRDRKRMKELFEFDYALEMFKPAAKRQWGYYALPILHGDRLVGKLDAAVDKQRGELVVTAIHEDAFFDRNAVDAELRALADWLGVELVRP